MRTTVPPSHFSHSSPTDTGTESQPSSDWVDQHDETVKQTGVDPASVTEDIAAIRAGIEAL